MSNNSTRRIKKASREIGRAMMINATIYYHNQQHPLEPERPLLPREPSERPRFNLGLRHLNDRAATGELKLYHKIVKYGPALSRPVSKHAKGWKKARS